MLWEIKMPITPFHFGPGLLLKELRPQFFSFTVFILSQIILDIESLYNILNHNEKIHAYFHTYIGSLVPLVISVLLYVVCKGRFFQKKMRKISLLGIIVTAWIGVWSHVFLDSIMHPDLQPFWPFSSENPVLGLIGIGNLHIICLICFIIGLGIYLTRTDFIKI